MRHILFVGQRSTLAGNSLFEVLKDWTLSGLVQETNWLDPKKSSEIVCLDKSGVKSYETSLWASSMIKAEDILEIFSFQLLISRDGVIGEAELLQTLSKLGHLESSTGKLVNIVFPTFGGSVGLEASCLSQNQNILVSPTDSHSPLTASLEVSAKSHQYFQHAAKELSSMAGIWPGQTSRTIPGGYVAPGTTDNIRLARSFVRYVDASSLVDEITQDVLSVDQALIPPAFDPETKAPLERVGPGESANQVATAANSFIQLFPELNYGPPPVVRIKAPETAGILQAIKLYFKWVFGWLRKQPKQLLQGFIHAKKAALASKVQELYGGENSKIAVYVGNVTTHGGQEWDSFDVTRGIQEAGSRHSNVKLAPAPPGQIWQTFFKTATALADGRDFNYQGSNPENQLALPRFQAEGGRRLISQPSHIVSDPKSSAFSIPVGLPLVFSGHRLTSEDPLLCKLALDEIREELGKQESLSVYEKTKLIELEESLEVWAKSNVSFSWLVGSALSEGIYNALREWHKGQQAINAKADDTKVGEAEAKAQASLKKLLKGGLAIVLTALGLFGGAAIWSLVATGALPLIGATWWIPVLIFSSIFAIWNILAATVLRGAIKEYFILDENLAIAANQYEKAKRQQSHIWGEIHRLTSFYQQYMYWCRILGPVIHRTEAKGSRKASTSVINSVHKLPAAMSVAKLMPNEGNTGDMTAQVKRDFYRPGWIEDSFNRTVRGLNIDLTKLYNDDANLLIGPLAKLSELMSDGVEVTTRFDEDATARVQDISTSGPSYQKWRVEPLGMIGRAGVDSGATFILDLLKGSKHIPDGGLLGSRGAVSGANESDETLTYVAADSRISLGPEMEGSGLERISPNPVHPLDFLGVRVELSKPFDVGLLSAHITTDHAEQDIETIKPPEA